MYLQLLPVPPSGYDRDTPRPEGLGAKLGPRNGEILTSPLLLTQLKGGRGGGWELFQGRALEASGKSGSQGVNARYRSWEQSASRAQQPSQLGASLANSKGQSLAALINQVRLASHQTSVLIRSPEGESKDTLGL